MTPASGRALNLNPSISPQKKKKVSDNVKYYSRYEEQFGGSSKI
jgi:hypothetical protein